MIFFGIYTELRDRLLSNKRIVNRIMSDKGMKGKVTSTERSINRPWRICFSRAGKCMADYFGVYF